MNSPRTVSINAMNRQNRSRMMKLMRTLIFVMLPAALSAPADAALTLVAAGTAGDHVFIGSPDVTFAIFWNTVPAGAAANIYWDADKDGVFGETGLGENAGNTSASLAFNAPITSGDPLHFGMDGFAGVDNTGAIQFTLQRTDASTIRQLVHEGSPFLFRDSTGEVWYATFDFIQNAYGDVVSNVSDAPGSNASDHQGVLELVQPLLGTVAFDDFVDLVNPQTVIDAGGTGVDVTATAIRPGGNPTIGTEPGVIDTAGSMGVLNQGSDTDVFEVLVESDETLTFDFSETVAMTSITLAGVFNNETFTLSGFHSDPGASENGSTAGFSFSGDTLSFNASASGRGLVSSITIDFANWNTISNLSLNTTGDGFGFTEMTFFAIPTPTALPAGLGLFALTVLRRKRNT